MVNQLEIYHTMLHVEYKIVQILRSEQYFYTQ